MFPRGDCCDVPGELDVSARRVFCAAEGSLTCGGVGATCSSPTLPGDLEPSRQCVSGTCCLNDAGDSGVCCDYGQECDENLRCRPRG
jgi:hypothetical protein